MDELEHYDFAALQQAYTDYLGSREANPSRERIDGQYGSIHGKLRELIRKAQAVKEHPGSRDPRNAPSVGKLERRLKTSLNRLQQMERDNREKIRGQFERQYLIVRPDASPAELREAEESQSELVFTQAMMNSSRRAEVMNASSNVKARHKDIQNIERQMMELAQLFQDLETLVVQQEPAVAQIEQKGEEVNEHVTKANVELDGAVKKARAARRKKWICLGIVGELKCTDHLSQMLIEQYSSLSLLLSSWQWLLRYE